MKFSEISWSGAYYFLEDGGLRRKDRDEVCDEVFRKITDVPGVGGAVVFAGGASGG